MTIQVSVQHIVHRKGWTFIELLTTIVVLAIASFVIVPLASSGASSAGQSATRFVVTDILAAQMDAIATQSYRRINFFENGSGWCVEVISGAQLSTPYDPATAQYAQDETESQGQNQQSIVDFTKDTRFRNINIKQALFDGLYTSVTFDPTGGIVAPDGSASTGGSFELHSGKYSWEVQIAPLTGKVTVLDLGETS